MKSERSRRVASALTVFRGWRSLASEFDRKLQDSHLLTVDAMELATTDSGPKPHPSAGNRRPSGGIPPKAA